MTNQESNTEYKTVLGWTLGTLAALACLVYLLFFSLSHFTHDACMTAAARDNLSGPQALKVCKGGD